MKLSKFKTKTIGEKNIVYSWLMYNKPRCNFPVFSNLFKKDYVITKIFLFRSKMEPADANKKFLDAMLLISYTKEMLELQKLHVLN